MCVRVLQFVNWLVLMLLYLFWIYCPLNTMFANVLSIGNMETRRNSFLFLRLFCKISFLLRLVTSSLHVRPINGKHMFAYFVLSWLMLGQKKTLKSTQCTSLLSICAFFMPKWWNLSKRQERSAAEREFQNKKPGIFNLQSISHVKTSNN